ncbi:MAG: peptide deformylase [Methylococcales bacterium]|nr:peptide deformylase [Methylococcales bacterium]MBT7442744.1 peptide deformylase [Methylococcales bacterium]
MTILQILCFPDPKLRTKAVPVSAVTAEIRTIVKNMFETMYDAPGIGLAATQVDIHQQIVVIDVSEEKNDPICLINPEIIESEGEESMEEGCLSVPGFNETVVRADSVVVRALNEEGEQVEFGADGLLAVCIQHEMDHLNGKLFVDYLSAMKRNRIKKKLIKGTSY